jgi:DNA-binding transcriptional MerR regulator
MHDKPQTHLDLPPIPAKRYFSIGEVSELCAVKPHVLRYWEQEFKQLKPIKRRGNRRYYQHHEVLLIRRIRGLLYEEGFTINGARTRLEEQPITTPSKSKSKQNGAVKGENRDTTTENETKRTTTLDDLQPSLLIPLPADGKLLSPEEIRQELQVILELLR